MYWRRISAISLREVPLRGRSIASLKSDVSRARTSERCSPANGARSLQEGENPRATANSSRKRRWKLLKSLSIASRVNIEPRHQSNSPSSIAPSLTVRYSTSLIKRVIEFFSILERIPFSGWRAESFLARHSSERGFSTISASSRLSGRKSVIFPPEGMETINPRLPDSRARQCTTRLFSPSLVVLRTMSSVLKVISTA